METQSHDVDSPSTQKHWEHNELQNLMQLRTAPAVHMVDIPYYIPSGLKKVHALQQFLECRIHLAEVQPKAQPLSEEVGHCVPGHVQIAVL